MSYYRSPKREIFIAEYIKCWNSTEAAQRAGYKCPSKAGPRLLRHPEVQRAIRERIEELCMGADEVLIRLAEQARGDMGEFLEIQPDGSVRVDLWRIKRAGKLHLLRRYSQDKKHGTYIELYDAQKALQLLGKHLGLFHERIEIEGQIDVGEIRKRLADRIHRIAAGGEAGEVPGTSDE